MKCSMIGWLWQLNVRAEARAGLNIIPVHSNPGIEKKNESKLVIPTRIGEHSPKIGQIIGPSTNEAKIICIYEGHSANSEIRCISAIAYLLAESWCCLYKAPTFISHNTKETIS